MSQVKALFASSPSNYVEGMNLEMNWVNFKINFKMNFIRLKRIFGYMGALLEWEYYIFFFRYPMFSYFMMIVLTLLFLFLDLNNIIQFLIILLISISLLYCPLTHAYI